LVVTDFFFEELKIFTLNNRQVHDIFHWGITIN
jgi:hypothetical protein